MRSVTEWVLEIIKRPESSVADHLDAGFHAIPQSLKHMLRWFPRFSVAAVSLSLGPSDKINRIYSPGFEVNQIAFPNYFFYH
jgi:hypothetical protein